ncbi:hypothetical protein NW762_011083 [Fusarium torreyae]|uniref:Xylanolytic transcriptional activator regulatory domain-containing protein n=1 Tax=Fusarium torreyae TaxID=1237075 RepID=A0A9W8RU35_9HYPO|nr:hypothetical protein NW762_011083 [Fusarium torreyae]
MEEAQSQGNAEQTDPGQLLNRARRGDGVGIGIGPRPGGAGSDRPVSAHTPPAARASRTPSLSQGQEEEIVVPNVEDVQQQSSPSHQSPQHVDPGPAAASSPKRNPTSRGETPSIFYVCQNRHAERLLNLDPVLAPATSLSSSETFSSELRTLLTERSRPNPGPTSTGVVDTTPRSICQARLGADNIKHWPTEEDAFSMLNIVVLNVGISQHLFDVRVFSDNLSSLFDDNATDVELSDLWYAECLLVFAIGRLLQAKWDDKSKPPGDEFFQEARKRLPDLSGLRKQGTLGIELMGLTALYLQVSDLKEDAYLYASTALRLSLGLSLHKSGSHGSRKRSEAVHRNRLWWSVYMQERYVALENVVIIA